MLEVHAVDDGGWAIVGGPKAETFNTLDEALATYLEQCGSVPKAAKLRDADSLELNGAWRWLPACEQEPEPIKGTRIDGEALREAAVSLNTRATPVVIDGGPTPPGMLPSEVHGTPMTGGNTLANGWAHTAAILVDRSGNVELYLWSEVVPVVAREIDAGRMGGGSVDLRYKTLEGDAPRGVSLGSFALTNDPAVTTLDPANAPRARADGLMSAVRTCRFDGRVLRASNLTPRPRSTDMPPTQKKPALRGPAMDAENKIFGLFGIDPTDEDADCDLSNAIWAVRQAADAEEAIAAIMGGAPLEPAEVPGAAAASAVPAPAVAMASAAFRTAMAALSPLVVARDAKGLAKALRDAAAPMTPEQSAALMGQIQTVLGDIFGKPDATPAELFDMLNAAADQIKGALAAKAAPPAGSDAGAPPPVQANATPPAVQASATTRSAEDTAALAELAVLRADKARQTQLDEIDAAFSKAQRTIPATDRKQLAEDLLAQGDKAIRGRMLTNAIRAAGMQPITGTVMPAATRGGNDKQGDVPASLEKAVELVREEAKKSLRAGAHRDAVEAKARVIARKRWPSLAAAPVVTSEV